MNTLPLVVQASDTTLRCAIVYRIRENDLSDNIRSLSEDGNSPTGSPRTSPRQHGRRHCQPRPKPVALACMDCGEKAQYVAKGADILQKSLPEHVSPSEALICGFKLMQSDDLQYIYAINGDGLSYCLVTGLDYQFRVAMQCLEQLAKAFNSEFGERVQYAFKESLSDESHHLFKTVCIPYKDSRRFEMNQMTIHLAQIGRNHQHETTDEKMSKPSLADKVYSELSSSHQMLGPSKLVNGNRTFAKALLNGSNANQKELLKKKLALSRSIAESRNDLRRGKPPRKGLSRLFPWKEDANESTDDSSNPSSPSFSTNCHPNPFDSTKIQSKGSLSKNSELQLPDLEDLTKELSFGVVYVEDPRGSRTDDESSNPESQDPRVEEDVDDGSTIDSDGGFSQFDVQLIEPMLAIPMMFPYHIPSGWSDAGRMSSIYSEEDTLMTDRPGYECSSSDAGTLRTMRSQNAKSLQIGSLLLLQRFKEMQDLVINLQAENLSLREKFSDLERRHDDLLQKCTLLI